MKLTLHKDSCAPACLSSFSTIPTESKRMPLPLTHWIKHHGAACMLAQCEMYPVFKNRSWGLVRGLSGSVILICVLPEGRSFVPRTYIQQFKTTCKGGEGMTMGRYIGRIIQKTKLQHVSYGT